MKTTYLRNLLTAVVCLMTGVTAQAQFSATYEDYVAEGFDTKQLNFSLSEVAAALGTDASTLVDAFTVWTLEGSTADNMFFLKVGDELSDNYTQGSKGGFWVNAEGAPQAWSDDNSGLRWYNTMGWAYGEEDLFSIHIGQFPGQCSVGDVFTPQFVLKYGEKQATFDITIKFVERPVYEVPDPATLLWKDLNVVLELTADVTQKQRTDYTADEVKVDLRDAAAKLGISDLSLIQNELSKLVYVTNYYIGEDVALGSMRADSLTNEPSANGIGFWLQALDNATGEGDGIECARSVYGNSHFYMEMFAFDAETGMLSCNMGQMPDKLEGDKQYYTYVYLIFGDKAVSIRYNLNVESYQLGTLEDNEKVGEETINLSMEPMNAYTTKNFNVDIDAIAAALGCEVSDIQFCALKDDVEFAASNADNGGYWFNMEGYVVGWGDFSMVYVMPVVANNFSKLGIGQYPGHLHDGDEISVSVYFVANGKYFKYTVNLKIESSAVFQGEFESVAQRAVEVQQVPVVYEWTPGIAIPNEWVEEQIGTSEWVVYGLAALNEDGSEPEGNARYTKNYTCTPNPGFWLSADGRNNGWNSNARIGITTAAPDLPEGGFALMQYEGDVCKIGDVFNTKLFLVNEANGKMVTFNFTYSIVESVQEIELVGTEDILVPVTMDGKTGATIDLSKVATALGTTVDEISNSNCLHGMTETGVYGGGTDFFSGLTFDNKGNCVTDEGYMYFEITLNDDGTTGTLTMYCNEAVADDFNVAGQFCILVGNKRYVYNARFVSESAYTGIEEIEDGTWNMEHSANAVYDLQGRRVGAGTKGIYIKNRQKYLVR